MVKISRSLEATIDGGFEIEAETAFEQAVEAIDELLAKLPSEPIEYAAISCFWHSLLGVDASGGPTTKLFAWGETRPARYVDDLKARFDESHFHNITGSPFHSSYWPAKLLWIKDEFEEAFSSTRSWFSFSDFIVLRLFDLVETSVSMASGTGLFDQRANEWCRDLIDGLNLSRDHFPNIAPDERTYRLNRKYAERWPQLAETNWYPAIGDGAANNIGADCVGNDRAALMIGTSGAMRVLYKGEVPETIPKGLWCYRADHKLVVIGGAISDGGGLYRWLKDTLRLSDDDDETEKKIAEREPAGHGLVFLPFLAGERSTGYHEFATGALVGLRTAHNSIDIAQAALESVAYRFASIYERLASVLPIKRITASGGALRGSPVWTQMIADVLEIELHLPETREASSRGAVLLASQKAGLIGWDEMKHTVSEDVFEPDVAKSKQYSNARRLHEELYEILIER